MIIKKSIFYKIANSIRRLYWFVFRPKTYGVKCLIESGGKFLFIRNSYGGKNWTFSGGGIKRKETPEEAVKREIKAELGINIREVKRIGEYLNTKEYKKDIVYCFYSKVLNFEIFIDKGEISEAQWFSKNKIPENRSSAVNKILEMYKEK